MRSNDHFFLWISSQYRKYFILIWVFDGDVLLVLTYNCRANDTLFLATTRRRRRFRWWIVVVIIAIVRFVSFDGKVCLLVFSLGPFEEYTKSNIVGFGCEFPKQTWTFIRIKENKLKKLPKLSWSWYQKLKGEIISKTSRFIFDSKIISIVCIYDKKTDKNRFYLIDLKGSINLQWKPVCYREITSATDRSSSKTIIFYQFDFKLVRTKESLIWREM